MPTYNIFFFTYRRCCNCKWGRWGTFYLY